MLCYGYDVVHYCDEFCHIIFLSMKERRKCYAVIPHPKVIPVCNDITQYINCNVIPRDVLVMMSHTVCYLKSFILAAVAAIELEDLKTKVKDEHVIGIHP